MADPQPEMAEVTRRNSGAYDANINLDARSAGSSQASIAARAQPPAGYSDDYSDQGTPQARFTASTDPGATNTQQTVTPWYKTRKFIIIQIIVASIGIVVLFVLLFPVVRAIAQLVVNKSTLDIQTAAIQQPQNGSFQLQMQGNVYHTGIFNAKITFTEPISVEWVDDTVHPPNLIQIGKMDFQPLTAKNKRATINQTSTFNISDEDAFGDFTAAMITRKNFTWRLTSNNLRVNADKFPVAKGIKFSKDVTLNGINNFDGNVQLINFQLPQDDPAGGITFVAVTGLNNKSPFKVDLGTVVFNLTYMGMFLGQGLGSQTTIVPGENQITLKGRLVSHNDTPSDLVTMGQLFSNFLNGELSQVVAQGVSTQQSDGTEISWLSKGLTNLTLNVPFVSPQPINAIHSIDIGYLNLTFTPETSWEPLATSNAVHASLLLPFGFDVRIGEIENSFAIMQNNSIIANLSTPLGASTSSVQIKGPTDTEGSINISLASSPLQIPASGHLIFSTFNTELTDQASAQFQLQGHSRAVANLSIGRITLDPINFNVNSSLKGLQGLQGSTLINGVDVIGGTTDHINLNINVSIVNPSSLNLNVGDLSLQLTRDGAVLGTALLPNLSLTQGNNTLVATSAFEANKSPQGQETLNDFVGKKEVLLGISGYDGSTKVESLLQAFESLNISATLPALKTNLLNNAALQILPTTGTKNSIAHVTVNLDNPFTAGLTITNVNSTVKSHGLNLGTISTATNFAAAGHKTSTSPPLEFNMNLDPPTLFTLLRRLAVQSGQGTDQLDGIVQAGGYQYVPSTDEDGGKISRRTPARRDNLYTGFNLPEFVDTAFKQLQSDIVLTSEVMIGEYSTTLEYTQTAVPVVTDSSLNLLLPLLAQPIVQKIITGSVLGIESVLISNPKQDSFDTFLIGSISRTGPFDAEIEFPSGLTISWSGEPLGNIAMPKVQVIGDVGAKLNLSASFRVADVDRLTSFTKVLLTEASFQWDISGENLTVSALGINVSGVALTTKTVTLKGMNGLKDGVVIDTFDLPSNDLEGGVHLTLQTTVTNPSQVGVALNSIGFNNFVESTFLGPVSSVASFTLAPQSTFNLPLVGRLVHQDSLSDLATVSQVFTDFIHGKSTHVTVVGNSAGLNDVIWLNDAIKTLQVSTVLPARGPLQVIKSIALKQLELDFTRDIAYAPSTSSSDVVVTFDIPFAFPIDIITVQQTITTSVEGLAFAQLAIPKGSARTDVASRLIYLTFTDVPFAVFSGEHVVFQQFLAQTTVSAVGTFQLSGSANTEASTAIGTLSLTGINFDVPTTLAGLQGLDTKPAVVSNLDVNHGFPDFLLIKVTTTLTNPSNLTISVGTVSFSLLFQGNRIGVAVIPNAVIIPGEANYATDVQFQPQGDAITAGATLLENFLQGVTSNTVIVGRSDTTDIESLVPALEQIKLNVDIPALHQNLITSARIVFPTDIVKTEIAVATVDITNPFTASINLLVVTATAIFENLILGVVDHVDASSNPVHAAGHTNITSPPLPLKFNLEPSIIIELLAIRASEKHVDLGPLTDLFAIVLKNPTFHPPIVATVDPNFPPCVSGKQFDVAGAILEALDGLEVTLNVDSVVKLDDYQTELVFSQFNVPAITDKTALFLIGAVAPPVVQILVDQASLSFDIANIANITDEGFDLSLHGLLTGTGPLDAQITFVEPLVVTWENYNIATIALPPVCAAANSGVPNYQTQGHLTITDIEAFTDFATFLLHNPSFEWTISTNKLRLTTLGTIFDGVSLSKTVTFKAFNGLPGVTISNFNLPHDDPAGGITISTDSTIPSPAQLSIELGTVTFSSFFNNMEVGPLTVEGLFLGARSTTKAHLNGRITPKNGPDLDTIGVLFSKFLSGQNQTLQVHGNSVDPSGLGKTVSWLSTAFKTLTLDVTLPGHVFKIIDSITIQDLEVELNKSDEDFNPLTSSKTTLATFRNPFGFSLQVVRAGEDLVVAFNDVDTAELRIPVIDTTSGISTGNVADLLIAFQGQTLHSLNNVEFGSFFAQITDGQSADVTLKGSASIVGRTAVGDVPISGIPFNVSSSIKGFNDFGRSAELSNVTIVGSGGTEGSQFVRSPLTTKIVNLSNVTLATNDITLPVFFKDVQIGRTEIENFDLVPGTNSVPAEFHYSPNDANDTTAQDFLATYLTSDSDILLTIKGDSASSPYGALQPALEGVVLTTSLTGINARFITHINVFITLDSLTSNFVSINFDLENPLDTPLAINFVQADASVGGEIFAHFDQRFDNFVVPAKGTANSGTFRNVLLVKGALASLPIIPLGQLDVSAAETTQVGVGGYTIPWLRVTQLAIPTTYNVQIPELLDLPLPALRAAVASMIASAKPSASSSPAVESSHLSAGGPTSPAASATLSGSNIPIQPEKQSSHEPASTPAASGTADATSPIVSSILLL